MYIFICSVFPPASRTNSLSLRSEEESPPSALLSLSFFPPPSLLKLYTPGRRNASFNILKGQSSAGRGEGSNETRQALAPVAAAKNNYKTRHNRRLTVVIRGSQLLIYWPAFFFSFFLHDLPLWLRSLPITEHDKASLHAHTSDCFCACHAARADAFGLVCICQAF